MSLSSRCILLCLPTPVLLASAFPPACLPPCPRRSESAGGPRSARFRPGSASSNGSDSDPVSLFPLLVVASVSTSPSASSSELCSCPGSGVALLSSAPPLRPLLSPGPLSLLALSFGGPSASLRSLTFTGSFAMVQFMSKPDPFKTYMTPILETTQALVCALERSESGSGAFLPDGTLRPL